MPLNERVSHPFVRVHIVNAETGMYLEKKMPDLPYVGTGDGYAPGIWNKESVSTLSLDPQNLLDVNWEHKDVDFLLPFATQFFDMRIKGNNSCQWNEEFIINEYA